VASLQVKPSFQKHEVSLWGNASMALAWLYGWLFSRWTTRLLRLRPVLMKNSAVAATSLVSPRAKLHGLLSTRRSTFGASSKRRHIRDAADQAARTRDAEEAQSTGGLSKSQRRTQSLLKAAAEAEQRAEYLRGITEDACLAWAARSTLALAEPVDWMGKAYGVWRQLDEQQQLKALRWETRMAPVLLASRKLVARRRAVHEQLRATTAKMEALLQALLEDEFLRRRAMPARRRYAVLHGARAGASVAPLQPSTVGPSMVPMPPPMPPSTVRPNRRTRDAAALGLRDDGTTGAPLRPPGSLETFSDDDDTPDTGIAF
jgi:hypothetical protein